MWALVHSPDPAHVERGLDLAQSMINARDIDQQHLNDLVYMCAVVRPSECRLSFAASIVQCLKCWLVCSAQAQYRRGSYQAARTQVVEYLKVKESHCWCGHTLQNMSSGRQIGILWPM